MLLTLICHMFDADIKDFSCDGNQTECHSRVRSCIGLTQNTTLTSNREKEKHYKKLLKFTKNYRKVNRNYYRKCEGPWIEEEFIAKYLNKPLSYFGGYIPIFVQWFALFTGGTSTYLETVQLIFNFLDTRYLYIVVSESDYGFFGDNRNGLNIPPNILILSASGNGHIAIPWVNCEKNLTEIVEPKYFLSFCGNRKMHSARISIIDFAIDLLGKDFFEYRGPEWIRITAESKFCLSPRGVAIACIRTTELLQMGMVPVVVTDDEHVLPYFPKLDWTEFALLSDISEFPRTVVHMVTMDDNEYFRMRNRSREVSHLFTMNGVLEEIDNLFHHNSTYFTCMPQFTYHTSSKFKRHLDL